MTLTPKTPRPPNFPLPPLLLIGSLICSFYPARWFPFFVLDKPQGAVGVAVFVLGILFVCFAVIMDIYVFALFRKNRTTIRPDKAATALVTSGPFSMSRNPIYVGNVAILIGCGFLSGIWLFAVFSVLTVWVLDRFQISYEEAHMAHEFGPDWDRYAAQVPRWL